jgi:hypothetical protein
MTCKHQPMTPTVNDSVPGPMFSNKAVFTLSVSPCSDGQARRFRRLLHKVPEREREVSITHSAHALLSTRVQNNISLLPVRWEHLIMNGTLPR